MSELLPRRMSAAASAAPSSAGVVGGGATTVLAAAVAGGAAVGGGLVWCSSCAFSPSSASSSSSGGGRKAAGEAARTGEAGISNEEDEAAAPEAPPADPLGQKKKRNPAPGKELAKPAPETEAKKVVDHRKPAPKVSPDAECLRRRRIFLTGEVTDEVAKRTVQELLYLEAEAPGTPIRMVVNSGGGKVHSGLAILDVMEAISSPVHTVVMGRAFSIAAVLVAGGEQGHRLALPHARLMIHEPTGSYPKLDAADLEIKLRELQQRSAETRQLLAKFTRKPEPEVTRLLERDFYMSAEEGRAFGLVDVVAPSIDAWGL